jgi:4-hydroxy 2-oxovalerate aldolase
MKIIDVTLRDGGFVSNFNWDLNKSKLHIATMENIGAHIVELGYWKQTEKSPNPFYNMNEDVLNYLTEDLGLSTSAAVMIDFSYCSKNLKDYPKKGDTRLELIRLTSRKEDFSEALKFAQTLKSETGLSISFQIINCTNYSRNELKKTAEKISETSINIVAFADSHGNLDLLSDWNKYQPAIEILMESNKEYGFHLHNHTGRAHMNFCVLKNKGASYIDGSVNGLGKGGGNLKLEEIVINENIPVLLNYMTHEGFKEVRKSREESYNILCGRANVTDNYRKMGIKHNVDLYKFQSILNKLEGTAKDSYSPSEFEFWI